MNAFEIIKNIIPDGIAQCKESIWDRLLIPDYSEAEPQDQITNFNSSEEFLDFELQKLASSNHYFEKEYYAARSMLSEEEYLKANFTYLYKLEYAPNYTEYKEKRQILTVKYKALEKRRQVLINLFEGKPIEKEEFEQLHFSEGTRRDFLDILNYAKFKFVNCMPGSDFYSTQLYLGYKILGRESMIDKGKININSAIEKWWCNAFHGTSAAFEDSYQLRRKVNELKSSYFVVFMQHKETFLDLYRDWEIRKTKHHKEQTTKLDEIGKLKAGYLLKNTDAVIDLTNKVLKCSNYHFEFNRDFEIDYNLDNKLLIVEYFLPSIENIPTIKETKYLSSKGEYRNILISQSDLLKLFDEAVYSICLRSIYEIFSNDPLEVINTVNFNGWIKSINKATGKEENTCIISIQVQRREFMDIDLNRVDPKTCFKHFKGVGSSKLYGITAIQPILQIMKNDKRFVDSQTVDFDDSTNLAAMAWEDFEHLIRELFEKEFSSNGGEVKVTQASRDGGVDAIAFDPDPIRGGKIVIQAKRYTNTVGVSAVRDLFGTVMNEGANKGILVTTSDYGSDSYAFAKGKPITLLNGANLLYLLEKHGTRAKIDINEARRLMSEEK